MKNNRASGFTLIELLIVIAIIGVLLQMLLPAVQMARESARRAQCVNGLRQWGLAMHNHHSSTGNFPIGAQGSYNNTRILSRRTWVVLVWPYIEEEAMFAQFDLTRDFYETPNSYPRTLDGICARTSPLYYCPSDHPGALWKGDSAWRARGSYVINWGNMAVPFNPDDPVQNPNLGVAPFGHEDYISGDRPRTTRFKNFTDGTSTTMIMSEIIIARKDTDYDIRGDMLNNDRPCTQYMTIHTPNSGIDVSPVCSSALYPKNPPCTTDGAEHAHKAARSKHPGGVNVLFGDGHVQFVKDSIAISVWRAIGTMNGSEIVQLD